MTTENENLTPIVRPIEILLSLDTYQGMTDEEIESVLKWKVEQYVSSADHVAFINSQTEMLNDLATRNQAILDASIERLNRELNYRPNLGVIS